MQIEQRFELPQPPDISWPAFCDIALLVDCLPGASLTGEPTSETVPLRFDVKLGPISAGFVGSGQVHFDDASRSGRFEGAAIDRRTQSRVKGAADFTLLAKGEGTLVTVVVDYALSGSLAQFSRGGILRELANALTLQFAANLAARLGAGQAEALEQVAVGNAGVAPQMTTASAPKPLAVGGLLWMALCAWARRLGRSFVRTKP
jgi:carbon monoxide dehydrogenase subunit G